MSTGRGRPDQREDPVGDLGGEGDEGGGADDALGGDDRVEHALQVGVGPGDHAAEHVACPGDGVGLEHLGDRGQPVGHRVVAAGLADLQGDERGHLVTQRGRIHLGSVPGDHAAVLQPLQAGLHGAAGDPEPPGGLQHADPGLGGEQFDQGRVQGVHPPGLIGGHSVQRYHGSFGINGQYD